MKFWQLIAGSVIAAGLAASPVRADVIADFDGSPIGGVTPQESIWQQYSLQFTATGATTTVGFLIRNDPSYTGLDNITVTSAGGATNLLTNGDLESGPDANSGLAPAGWYQIGTPNLSAHGVWQTGTPDGTYNSPESGSGWWYDGAVGGHDGIAQDIQTIAGQTYNLTFWLGGDPVPNGDTVDDQVLAGALPAGTEVLSGTPDTSPVTDVPEPVSASLLAAGFGLLALRRRAAPRCV